MRKRYRKKIKKIGDLRFAREIADIRGSLKPTDLKAKGMV